MAPAGSSSAASLDVTAPQAPPGYVPQETWLQNLGMAVEIVMPVVALIFTGLRAYSRILTKTLGADDYCLFTAMLFSIAQAVAATIYIKLAYIGIHIWEIPPHDPIPPGIWAWIAVVLYNPILVLVKISVLVFLLRLASIKPLVRNVSWVLIVFTAAHGIGICLTVLFMCHPIQFNWDRKVEGGYCVGRNPSFALSTAALGILTDCTTLAIPFWIFPGLRISRKAKIALLTVFGLGILVTLIGMLRLGLLAKRYFVPRGEDSNFDITYTISSFENNLAIIAACGPALWPLARRVFPSLFTGLGLSQGYQGDIEDIDTTRVILGDTVTTVHSSRRPGSSLARWRESDSAAKVVMAQTDSEGKSEGEGEKNWQHDSTCQCGIQLDDEGRAKMNL